MGKLLKYYINKDQKVIVEVLNGKISLNEYKDFKTIQVKDIDFNPSFSFIVDIRAVDIVFSEELKKRMKQYLEFVKPIDSLAEKKNVAVITNTPDQVVYSTINKTLDKRKITYGIFSSKQAALNWLNISSNGMDMIDDYSI